LASQPACDKSALGDNRPIFGSTSDISRSRLRFLRRRIRAEQRRPRVSSKLRLLSCTAEGDSQPGRTARKPLIVRAVGALVVAPDRKVHNQPHRALAMRPLCQTLLSARVRA
jgi:hypothetical protein